MSFRGVEGAAMGGRAAAEMGRLGQTLTAVWPTVIIRWLYETRASVALQFFPFPGGTSRLRDSSVLLEQQVDDLWIIDVLTENLLQLGPESLLFIILPVISFSLIKWPRRNIIKSAKLGQGASLLRLFKSCFLYFCNKHARVKCDTQYLQWFSSIIQKSKITAISNNQ